LKQIKELLAEVKGKMMEAPYEQLMFRYHFILHKITRDQQENLEEILANLKKLKHPEFDELEAEYWNMVMIV
jgi:hypothetical protein